MLSLVRELVVSALLLFLAHALAYSAALLGAGVVVLVSHPTRWRRWARTLLGLAPSLAAATWWFATHFFEDQADRMGAITASTHAQGGAAVFREWSEVKERALSYLSGAMRGDEGQTLGRWWLYAVAGLCAFGVVHMVLRRARLEKNVWRGRTVLVGCCLMALYVIAPTAVGGVWGVAPRFLVWAALGLLLMVPPLGRATVAMSTVLGIFFAALTSAAYTDLLASSDLDTRGFRQVLAEAEPGKRLYGIVMFPYGQRIAQPILLHMPAYYVVDGRGLNSFTFLTNSSAPARLRTLGASPYPGRHGEWDHRRFRPEMYAPYYDYLLLGYPRAMNSLPADTAPFELLAMEGRWALFQNNAAAGRVVSSLGESLHRANVRDQSGECVWTGSYIACPSGARLVPGDHAYRGIVIPSVIAEPAGSPLEVRHQLPPASELRGFAGLRGDTPAEFEVEVDGTTHRVVVDDPFSAWSVPAGRDVVIRFRETVGWRAAAFGD